MTYFIEIFGGKKLIAKYNINKFLLGNDPQENINNYEREWKRIGYRDARVWPHLFPLTLDDLPNNRYKMEEEHGDTFTRKKIKEKFIKDFSFNPQEEKPKEATKHIKEFVQIPSI